MLYIQIKIATRNNNHPRRTAWDLTTLGVMATCDFVFCDWSTDEDADRESNLSIENHPLSASTALFKPEPSSGGPTPLSTQD